LGLAWWDLFDTGITGGSAVREAVAEAQRSGLPGAHNGEQDAFRHCVWQCLAKRQAGSFDAWLAGTGHEYFPRRPQPENEFNSDMCNNRRGREAADEPGTCPDACMKALNSGELNVLSSDGDPGSRYY
jgi:hypothetical protein